MPNKATKKNAKAAKKRQPATRPKGRTVPRTVQVITRPQRASRDPKLSAFMRMVQNPWNGPVVGSPVADRNIPQTNVIRRTSVFAVNLADGARTTTDGVELAFVMNGLRDPYCAVGTDFSTTPVISYHGRGQGTAIPADSYARVIASGVKITYLGNAHERGGVWSHFNYARESSNLTALTIGPSWGSLAAAMQYAVSSHPTTTAPLKFIDSPETGFCAVKLLADTELDAGLPAPERNVAVMRLLYQGPKSGFNFRFEVSEVLEYFHTTHEMWSRPAVQHVSGEALVVSANNVLSLRGSDSTVNPDKPGWFERIGGAISKGAGIAKDVIGVVEKGVKVYQSLGNKGASAYRSANTITQIEEVGEELGALAVV